MTGGKPGRLQGLSSCRLSLARLDGSWRDDFMLWVREPLLLTTMGLWIRPWIVVHIGGLAL